MSIITKTVICSGPFYMEIGDATLQDIECFYYVDYKDTWRKSTITVSVETAKQLIEVLQEYLKYKRVEE